MSRSTRLGFQGLILLGTSLTTYNKRVVRTFSDTPLYLLQTNEMFSYINRPPIQYELRVRLPQSFLIATWCVEAASQSTHQTAEMRRLI